MFPSTEKIPVTTIPISFNKAFDDIMRPVRASILLESNLKESTPTQYSDTLNVTSVAFISPAVGHEVGDPRGRLVGTADGLFDGRQNGTLDG